ncbi:DUF2764 family protein [Methylomonas rhizoryzae]|uniref:DUF2764 family protein n=1 Tax=Methylomonas rhizoryzae TaxID=2608981 RepID=UPI001231FB6B|nr:DUF2764 family protein [Methylomonas rhizoryzae]
MLPDCRYAMLIGSLPPQPMDLFGCRLPVISRIQLDRRLALLAQKDAADLQRIEGLLHWSKMQGGDDADIFEHGRRELDSIRSDFLRDIVAWRLELRTLLSALRRRQAGLQPAPGQPFCGFGARLPLIRHNWHKPDFGLGHALPWISQAQQLMAQHQPLALDKLLLQLNWHYYARLNLGHYFDFPAVVLYVLRWDLIHRWATYDGELAVARFDELVEAGLAAVQAELEGTA